MDCGVKVASLNNPRFCLVWTGPWAYVEPPTPTPRKGVQCQDHSKSVSNQDHFWNEHIWPIYIQRPNWALALLLEADDYAPRKNLSDNRPGHHCTLTVLVMTQDRAAQRMTAIRGFCWRWRDSLREDTKRSQLDAGHGIPDTVRHGICTLTSAWERTHAVRSLSHSP